ncbi:MAG: hypothetical protein CMI73_02500 [Candidatus Pelagibacter sp.]|nr:hypothetical protein [Candidatus Pelagibacter sp.]OUV87271.1 MAG: hypothetical protein CBC96_02270 [Pelagibacteraceae bacterium TMED136]|tara:strand:- start:625 stop:2025 length:1401 start_codon:yes stop_codon:yes gene_type:complete
MNLSGIFYYLGKINLLIIFFSFINLLYCFYFDFKINVEIYFYTFLISTFYYLITFKIKFKIKKFRANNLILFAIMGWIILPLLMSLPFWLGGYSNFLNSYFESVSGFTSFGATIFTNKINTLDSPILLWRSSTQVVGSIFFIITIILVFGNRAINIYPLKFITRKKDSVYFSINFKNVFNNTVYAYVIVFLISIFFLNLTDLRMLDKFNLSLTIISTGGFQSSNLMLSNFDKIILSILLIFSSLNIFLILGIMKINNTYNYYEDKYFLFSFVLFFLFLFIFSNNSSFADILIQLSSAISNSGINFTNNYSENTTFILITASFFGGCLISSTSGFKISRILIIFNKIYYELLKLLTPSAVINSTIFKSDEKIEFKDFYSSSLLLLLYIIIFIIFSFVLTLENISFENSFLTSVLLTFNTLPSTMYINDNVSFASFSEISKILTILMLILSKVTPISLLALIKYRFIK